MRVIDGPALLAHIFESEPELPSRIEAAGLIARGHADVYRVRCAERRFIAHISRNGTRYLQRLRTNLASVEFLGTQVPRVVGWWPAERGDSWGVLVCEEVPGTELARENATPAALDSLADLLLRLHSVDAPVNAQDGVVFTPDDPRGFGAFAQTLLGRLADLPINRDRVSRHLATMAGFLEDHANAFGRIERLIHGDLHRSNVVVDRDIAGLLDWSDLTGGDYAYDLAALKFVLDSIAPRRSAEFVRQRARLYRDRFNDATLELRLRFFLSLAGLVRAVNCADDTEALQLSRAWRVRACYLHSEAQWRAPLRLDGPDAGAPARRTEEFAVDLRQPIRGLFYLVAPKRIS
jgi:aminoglycoside phosphotransferase (APT) family kinase protein